MRAALTVSIFACSVAGAAAPGAPRPIVYARASLRSVDAVVAAAQLWGIPIPDEARPEVLVANVPALSQGGLDRTRPLAVLLSHVPGKRAQDGVVFAVPVGDVDAARGRILEGLQGAKARADGTIVTERAAFRLADGYVVWAIGPDALDAFDAVALPREYETGAELARASVDLGRLAGTGLDQWYDLFDWFDPMEHDEGRERGTRFLLSLLPRVFDVGVMMRGAETGKRSARVRLSTRDMRRFDLTGLSAPGFPPRATFRLDLAPGGGRIAEAMRHMIRAMVGDDVDFEHLDDDGRNATASFLARAVDFLVGGDAVSFALARRDGGWVAYLARQYRDAVDVMGAARKLVAESHAIVKLVGSRDPFALQRYRTARGEDVFRLVCAEPADDDPVVDCLPRGNIVYTTVSELPGRYVEELASCAPAGKLSSGFSFEVDIDRLVADVARDPGTALYKVREGLGAGTYRPFDGVKARCVTHSVDGLTTIDVSVPQQVVSGVMQIGVALGLGGAYDEDGARLEAVTRQLVHFPDYLPLQVARAEALVDVGRPEEAAFAMDVPVAMGVRSPLVYAARSRARYFAGEYRGALADARRQLAWDALGARSEVDAIVRVWHVAHGIQALKELAWVEGTAARRSEQTRGRSWPWPLVHFIADEIDADALVAAARKAGGPDAAGARARFVIAMKHREEGDVWEMVLALEDVIRFAGRRDVRAREARHEYAPFEKNLAEWKKLSAEARRLARAGDISGALETVQRCMYIARAFGETGLLAGSAHMLRGEVMFVAGRHADAETEYKRARAIWEARESTGTIGYARILNMLGVIAHARGRTEEGLGLVARSIDVFQHHGRFLEDLYHPLRNKAELLTLLGRDELAMEAYVRMLEFDQKVVGSASAEAKADLEALAALAKKVGRERQAADYLRQAAAIVIEAKDAGDPEGAGEAADQGGQ